MNKKKSVFLGVGIFIGVLGLIVGVLFWIKDTSTTTVNVYAVSDLMTYSDDISSQAYGSVKADQLQSIYVSDTQQVTKVLVTQGQQVNVGDELVEYDTTLTQLELQEKEVSVERIQLQIEQAKKELLQINAYKPYTPQTETPVTTVPETTSAPETTADTVQPTPAAMPQLLGGTGTETDPYRYLWDSTCEFTQDFAAKLLNGQNQAWAQFYIYENNDPSGKLETAWGMVFSVSATEGYTFTVYPVGGETPQPDTSDTTDTSDTSDVPDTSDDSSGYTAAEIAEMKTKKQAEIVTLGISLKMAQVEYKEMQEEMDAGSVKSKISGTVVSVTDADTAKANGEPIIKVSGGGGYLVTAAIGEFDRSAVSVGQEVQVTSMESGISVTGTVQKISDSPTTDNQGWSNGNNNISWYPITVFVSGSEDLKEDEMVYISYTTDTDTSDSIYLMSPFVLTEDGASYIYVENDSGVLEKRQVTTGKSLYGSYLEIKGGLTADEYVAFPYGSGVTAGAKTAHATMDQLYS